MLFRSGLATMVLLWRHRPGAARLPAVVAVGAVLSGWGVGQYPWLLVDHVTIAQAAGATATLEALLVAVGVAVVVVLPALVWLLVVAQQDAGHEGPDRAQADAGAAASSSARRTASA